MNPATNENTDNDKNDEDKNWNNPIGVSVVLLPVVRSNLSNKIYLLGVRRGIEPQKGNIALPGGYINEGETACMAGARELLEETNILVNSTNFMLYDEHITFQNRHLIFIKYKYSPLKLDSLDLSFSCDETEALVLISKEDILDNLNKDYLCFPSHHKKSQRFFMEM